MSEEKNKFRKVMGGYNKEDVNRYIQEMSSKHYDIEFNYRKRIIELETRVRELEQKEAPVSEDTGEDLSELRLKTEQSENLIEKLNETIQKINEEKEELLKENADLKARISECEKINETSADIYEKSTKYDQVSGQIGSLILNMNAKAESIVSEAQLKARLNSSAMIDNTVDKLQQINEKYINEITTKAIQLTEELRELSLSADNMCANTRAALENERIQLKESLESTKKVIMESIDE